MRLTPRKAEVEAVVSILETDNEYDTLESMAKDIIETVYERFLEREWYAYGVQFDGLSIGYGPFTSANEAGKFRKRLALGLPDGLAKLYSPAGALDRLAEGEDSGKTDCSVCAHPRGLHEHPK